MSSWWLARYGTVRPTPYPDITGIGIDSTSPSITSVLVLVEDSGKGRLHLALRTTSLGHPIPWTLRVPVGCQVAFESAPGWQFKHYLLRHAGTADGTDTYAVTYADGGPDMSYVDHEGGDGRVATGGQSNSVFVGPDNEPSLSVPWIEVLPAHPVVSENEHTIALSGPSVSAHAHRGPSTTALPISIVGDGAFDNVAWRATRPDPSSQKVAMEWQSVSGYLEPHATGDKPDSFSFVFVGLIVGSLALAPLGATSHIVAAARRRLFGPSRDT